MTVCEVSQGPLAQLLMAVWATTKHENPHRVWDVLRGGPSVQGRDRSSRSAVLGGRALASLSRYRFAARQIRGRFLAQLHEKRMILIMILISKCHA